nr:MAG TPA: hypothetical protein [Caudoviricetes sp.]DAS49891.1 MAG TPA: hypothetical protein [Caudoviricetes sp.]DAX30228.1 MAG TPA: hypothetical protein [Caudoviricetes sp.]DAX82322.1 MAG TPA: hypothetical protein [Caudoviricetes sp.]
MKIKNSRNPFRLLLLRSYQKLIKNHQKLQSL